MLPAQDSHNGLWPGICATEKTVEPKQSKMEAYWPSAEKLGQAHVDHYQAHVTCIYNKKKKIGQSLK